jgi:hypothetical protein
MLGDECSHLQVFCSDILMVVVGNGLDETDCGQLMSHGPTVSSDSIGRVGDKKLAVSNIILQL